MAKKDPKQLQDEIVDTMKRWQKVENAAIASTGQIIEKTENPLIRMVAQIIQRDSHMHYGVQGFIVDSIEREAISLTSDELVQVWDLIEAHIEIEKQTMELATQLLEATKGQQGMIIQDYLMNYLAQDEQKHIDLLDRLDDIKAGIYRSV
jgi:hypothetical protein